MAKAEEFQTIERVDAKAAWEKEPWYGTSYRVERFGDDFMKQVNTDASPSAL